MPMIPEPEPVLFNGDLLDIGGKKREALPEGAGRLLFIRRERRGLSLAKFGQGLLSKILEPSGLDILLDFLVPLGSKLGRNPIGQLKKLASRQSLNRAGYLLNRAHFDEVSQALQCGNFIVCGWRPDFRNRGVCL